MTFSTLQEVKDYINSTITSNGEGSITGPEVHDILQGLIEFLDPVLVEDLTVQQGSGGSVGGSNTGEIFVAGTSLEAVLRDILIKTVHPTYLLPTLVLNTNDATLDKEIGTNLAVSFSTTYTQNDAGGITGRSLKKNGSVIATAFPASETSQITQQSVYQALINFAEGSCKVNNLSVTDCNGHIMAGTVSSQTITYNAYRKAFFGVASSAPTTSAQVRALSSSALNPVEGGELSFTVPQGSVSAVFTYPATLRDVSFVYQDEIGSPYVQGLFTKTTVNVEGANGYTAISYKVFTFTPIEPFQTSVTYRFKI